MRNEQDFTDDFDIVSKQEFKNKDNFGSQKCYNCGGRLALISGNFYYEPDQEPYNSGIEEDAEVESGDCRILGYKCDDCELVQGLWNE